MDLCLLRRKGKGLVLGLPWVTVTESCLNGCPVCRMLSSASVCVCCNCSLCQLFFTLSMSLCTCISAHGLSCPFNFWHTRSQTLFAVSIAVSWYSELSDRIRSILALAALCFENKYLSCTLEIKLRKRSALFPLSHFTRKKCWLTFPLQCQSHLGLR